MDNLDPSATHKLHLDPVASQELLQLRQEFKALRMVGTEHDKAPDLVWHYTSAEGLLGILNSGHLWATHIQYLDDPQEMVYGTRLLDSVIDDLLKAGQHSSYMQEWLKWISIGQNFQAVADDVFVTCFCSAKNLLPQW